MELPGWNWWLCFYYSSPWLTERQGLSCVWKKVGITVKNGYLRNDFPPCSIGFSGWNTDLIDNARQFLLRFEPGQSGSPPRRINGECTAQKRERLIHYHSQSRINGCRLTRAGLKPTGFCARNFDSPGWFSPHSTPEARTNKAPPKRAKAREEIVWCRVGSQQMTFNGVKVDVAISGHCDQNPI